jgi:serine/threonine protein kinase/Tol biopolymer transport system component
MRPERWRRLEQLYHSASERHPSQRSAFLDAECGGDQEMRAELELMLAKNNSPQAFLDRPAWAASPYASASVSIGTQLGAYRIESVLGQGGMGVVYRALDTKLNRTVAVKLLSDGLADAASRRRFQREAQTASSLNHPHILTVHDAGEVDGRQYLVTEFVDGGTLRDWARAEKRGWAQIVELLAGVADGLAAAHEAGILHRDIKPANILVAKNGYAKLADFGLAKLAGGSEGEITRTATEQATGPGLALGTLAYMSPEQASGKPMDARSDIFSFGVVLYELLAGHRPLVGANDLELMQNIIHGTPQPLSAEIPVGLRAVVEKALEKDPAHRYQSMREMVVDLRRAERDSSSHGSAPGLARRMPRRGRPLKFALAAGAAVLLLILLAAGAAWMLHRAGNNSAMPGPVTQITPVTSYLGDELEPALSPDGSQVAFSWNGEKGDNRDIYVKQIGGQTPLRLTQDPAVDDYPAWSPDGSQIAFLRHREADHWTIELVSSLGGPERKLYDVGLSITFVGRAHPLLAWSPDGKQIVFTQADQETRGRLYALSLETGLAHLLQLGSFRNILDDSSPSISPDGRWLAFTRSSGPRNGILMVQRLRPGIEPAGDPTAVPDSGPNPSSPCWSPDSKRLVFADQRRIFAWEVGGSVRPIYAASGALGGLTATWRSGRLRAIAASRTDNSYIWALPIDPVTHTVSGPAVPRVRSSAVNGAPSLSPDGRTLAFTSDRSGSDEVWLADADGENQRQLTRLDAYITGYPRWSPDGKQIAFHARLPEVPQIYVVDADGGVPRKVTSAAFGFFAPTWAMDGKHFFATGKADGKDEIFRIGVADGKTEPLFGASESAPTPDGKRILYGKVTEPGIFSRALEGDPSRNPEERLVDDFIVLYGSMLPVPSGIYYTGFTPQVKPPARRFFDYATHRSKDIAPAPFRLGTGLTLSPDQHELLYSAMNDSSGADLLLLEFQ